MVLVDTSVWIRALSGVGPFRKELDHLLSQDEVLGHEFVYGELLMGDAGGRRKALAAYAEMHQARVVPHGEVASFVRQRRLHGRGIGWVDAHLLASALVERAALWTADEHLARVATSLGLARR
jgi:predicted nucleic acid-binding protein